MTPDPNVAPLIAIVGATGTGKSELSLDLACELADRGHQVEIVGADAMQLYRGMDIGTAKVAPDERRGIPHHLIDVLDPHQEATVAAYQRDARAALASIRERGAVPILVGGSGLYVNSALYEFQFPGSDPVIRADLERILTEDGLEEIVRLLINEDPNAKTTVDLENPRRVVRALEVLRLTGSPIASSLPERPRAVQPTMLIGVREDRATLVQRLDSRVERMWHAGLLDEIRDLLDRGLRQGPTASRAIGYAQGMAQIDGQMSATEAIEETKALTRRYARRQVSWFKRLPGTHWVESRDLSSRTSVSRLAAHWESYDVDDREPLH